MTDSGEDFDFAALEKDIEIDRQVRLARAMLDLDEAIISLASAQASCHEAFDELEKMLDALESRRGRNPGQ